MAQEVEQPSELQTEAEVAETTPQEKTQLADALKSAAFRAKLPQILAELDQMDVDAEESQRTKDLLAKAAQVGVDLPPLDRKFEAIILTFGRPTIFVRDNKYALPPPTEFEERGSLNLHHVPLCARLQSVGRVNLKGSPDTYFGTAWMIAPDVAVTNAHVARFFTDSAGQLTREIEVDFCREHLRSTTRHARVTEMLKVSSNIGTALKPRYAPDVALMRVEPEVGMTLPPPLPLSEDILPAGASHRLVLVVGYPAVDLSVSAALRERLFGNEFGYKRAAPGFIVGVRDDQKVCWHDATTLGGSSGSAVMDVGTQKVLGLHFAGYAGKRNYAVTADTVRQFAADFL